MLTFFRSAIQHLENFTLIEFFYVAIGLFTSIILAMIGAMLYVMLAKSRIEARQKQLQAQFKRWVITIVLQESDKQLDPFDIPEEIQALMYRAFARKTILIELVRLKSELSGQAGDNLTKLYNQLKLYRLSAHDMRSNSWYRKAKGIQELAAMEQRDYLQEIFSLANHPHPMVRTEAQTALVYLQQYEGLKFLEHLAHPLTEWHQVKLLQLLTNHPIPSADQVKGWLTSSNSDVVQFALKLIGEQHATQFQHQVINCLVHPEETVRQEAITCLGEIPSAPVATALRAHYPQESSSLLRLNIISGLMKTGSTTDLPFLQELYVEPDAHVQFAAKRTIRHLQQQI